MPRTGSRARARSSIVGMTAIAMLVTLVPHSTRWLSPSLGVNGAAMSTTLQAGAAPSSLPPTTNGVPGPSQSATATATAQRIAPPIPPMPYDVIVLGDSLTYIGRDRLRAAVTAAGWRVLIDGKSGRSIDYPSDLQYSALAKVSDLRAAGLDAQTWIVALGTNDLYFLVNCKCPDPRAAAVERIRSLLRAIGAGHRIVWVGPQNFSYTDMTALFNGVLQELVASGEISSVVDWETLSAAHRLDYFNDNAHLSAAGYDIWVPAITASLGPLPPSPD